MELVSGILAALAVALTVPKGPAGRRRRLVPASPPPRPSSTVLALIAIPLVAWLVLGPVAALLTGAALPVVRHAIGALESRADRERRELLERQLPMALDLVSALIESGRAPTAAVRVVAEAVADPLATELESLVTRLSVSADPAQVWHDLRDDRVVGVLARAFGRAETSGMPVVRLIAQAAVEQRRVFAAQRRVAGAAVASRSTLPLGACFLPAFFLLAIAPTIVGSLGSLLP